MPSHCMILIILHAAGCQLQPVAAYARRWKWSSVSDPDWLANNTPVSSPHDWGLWGL